MVNFGPRLTGSSGHKNFLNYIENTLLEAGFEVSPLEMAFQRWHASEYSLVIHDGSDVNVTIAYPFVRSNLTGSAGITYPLGLLEPYPIASNRIAIVDANYTVLQGFEMPPDSLNFTDLANVPYYKPVIITETDDNVKGIVLCLNESLDRIQYDYNDFESTVLGKNLQRQTALPILVLDKDTCVSVKSRIGYPATLKLTGTYAADTTKTILGILPGHDTSDYIFLGTHTDGQNAIEENAIAAKLSMAKYLAQNGPHQKSLLFAAMTGHMAAYDVPYADSWGLCNANATLMSKVSAAIDFEHLGVNEEDAGGPYNYYASSDVLAYLLSSSSVIPDIQVSVADTPPAGGSAAGLRPDYCLHLQGHDTPTVAGA